MVSTLHPLWQVSQPASAGFHKLRFFQSLLKRFSPILAEKAALLEPVAALHAVFVWCPSTDFQQYLDWASLKAISKTLSLYLLKMPIVDFDVCLGSLSCGGAHPSFIANVFFKQWGVYLHSLAASIFLFATGLK